MQYSNFLRTVAGNTISFINTSPILKVDTIKYFTDNTVGTFSKKEIRWSFNNTYWASWETLNQKNVSGIDIGTNQYLYLEIRYTLKSINSGTVTKFILNYTEVEADVCEKIIPKYTPITERIVEITNADTLEGEHGSYYLDRSHHTGIQSIATITNLQDFINYYNNFIADISSGVSKLYVDGSLATRDASIVFLFDNKANLSYVDSSLSFFIKEVSLGSEFYWADGSLGVTGSGGISQAYVDGSLALRDASITYLFNWNFNIESSIAGLDNIYIKESSLGYSFYWDSSGFLDVSTSSIISLGGLTDVSIVDSSEGDYLKYDSSFGLWRNIQPVEASVYFYTKEEVDAYNDIQDSSILLKADLTYVDVSLNNIRATYIPDVSLSTDFYWGGGLLEVSVGFGGVTLAYVDGSLALRDTSISFLNTRRIINEASIGWLTNWNSSQDVSINFIKATYIPDVSLGTFFFWNNGYLDISTFGIDDYLDGSLNNIRATYIPDASLSVSNFVWNAGYLEVSTAGAGVTQAYVDGSLNNIRATYIPDSSLSTDFYWSGSNLLRVDVSSAGSVSSTLDYTTYQPFVGDVSFNYTGDLVSQIVTINSIGTKVVDFVYDLNDDVSTITIDNYGEATRIVTFEKDVDENVIAVHIV